jgi:hypothetical protein
VLLPRHRTIHHWHVEIMANIIYTCEAKRQKGLLVLISNQREVMKKGNLGDSFNNWKNHWR